MDRFWAVAGPSTHAQRHLAGRYTFLKCSFRHPPMCRRLAGVKKKADGEPGKRNRRLHFSFIFGAVRRQNRERYTVTQRTIQPHPHSRTPRRCPCSGVLRSRNRRSGAATPCTWVSTRSYASQQNQQSTGSSPLGSSSWRCSRRWTGVGMTIRHPVHRAVRPCARRSWQSKIFVKCVSWYLLVAAEQTQAAA